jgi:hypothetical protein
MTFDRIEWALVIIAVLALAGVMAFSVAYDPECERPHVYPDPPTFALEVGTSVLSQPEEPDPPEEKLVVTPGVRAVMPTIRRVPRQMDRQVENLPTEYRSTRERFTSQFPGAWVRPAEEMTVAEALEIDRRARERWIPESPEYRRAVDLLRAADPDATLAKVFQKVPEGVFFNAWDRSGGEVKRLHGALLALNYGGTVGEESQSTAEARRTLVHGIAALTSDWRVEFYAELLGKEQLWTPATSSPFFSR